LNLFRLDAKKVERNYGSKIQRSSKLSKRKLNLLSENFKWRMNRDQLRVKIGALGLEL
jgi:hypothetical protein